MRSILSINIDSLYDLPCAVYLKNTQGLYLECNQYVASKAGLNSTADIAGLGDIDLPWSKSAEIFSANDRLILSKENRMSFIEDGVIITGEPSRSLSYKMPLYSSNNKLLGVLGLSFPLNLLSLSHLGELLQDKKQLTPILKPNQLTPREQDIARLLARGGTARSIANSIGISYRTVENHVANIKLKLAVSSKVELMEKLINIF